MDQQICTGVIAAIGARAAAAARSLWPESEEEADFIPQLEAARGDLSSDLPIRLADRLRLPPDEIGARIIAALDSCGGDRWSIERGYLNVILSADVFAQLCREGAQAAELRAPLRVLVPPRMASLPAAAFARVLGHALVQIETVARLWSGSVSLELPGLGELTAADAVARGGEIFDRGSTVFAPADSLAAVMRTIGTPAASGARAVVWLPAQLIGSAEWRELGAIPGFFRSTRLRFIDRRCLTGLDQGPPSSFAAPGGDVRAVWWYVSEDRPGSDIDWHAAGLCERQNIRWYVDSLFERLDRIGIPSAGAEQSPHPAVPREIRCAPMVARYASLHGEVYRVIAAIRTTADQIAAILNDPDSRRALEAGDRAGTIRDLLASARQALSIMIDR